MTAYCHTQYHWVVCHPLYTLFKEGPIFHCSGGEKAPTIHHTPGGEQLLFALDTRIGLGKKVALLQDVWGARYQAPSRFL